MQELPNSANLWVDVNKGICKPQTPTFPGLSEWTLLLPLDSLGLLLTAIHALRGASSTRQKTLQAAFTWGTS